MGQLSDQVLAWFDEDGWSLDEAGDGHTWVATVEGENGRWTTVLQLYDDRGVFAFYSVLPVSPSSSQLPTVLEYVARANSGLVTGNFEVDVDAAQVRYKTAIDLSDVPPAALTDGVVTRALVSDLTYTNAATTDRYLPGLLQVVSGGATPAAAIAAVEG